MALSVTAFSAEAAMNPTFFSRYYPQAHAKGLVRTPESRHFLETAPRVSFANRSETIPGNYSMRGLAGPVEDQGQCGSCWDFSLTSALRGTWMMGGKDPGRLSFNYLLNCDKVDLGCDGGDFPAAANFIDPLGDPAYGSDGEYTATDGACTPAKAVASAAQYHLLGKDGGVNPTGTTPSFADIAYVVGVLHRPVSIDVAVDMTWEYYGGGVYNGCSDEDARDINHMVTIEGYDCEAAVDANGNCKFDANGNLPAGVGTWLIRNSWGTSWGDGGYITTKATDKDGKACNAVATDALYFDL
jgi:hypothetical protein